MNKTNNIIYGVKKLVMINSATVEYLKLDLDLPLHLNAENNLGKTSTVNTLQFLYIDYVNDMFLPSSVQESIKFYFRDEYSYLIFECVSKTGTHCVILNRPAGSSKYYNRHLIKCEYTPDIFIDNKLRPMSWENVLEKLSELNLDFATVTHKEWWRSLSGFTDNKAKKRKIPSLFILPVKDHESYKRFKMIYCNLLSMSSITLDTFKDILLSCAVASGEKRKIDFAEKDYKGTFEKCRNLQAQHQYYIEHEQEISEIRETEKSLQKFKRNMPARFCVLRANYDTYRENLEREIDTAEDRKIKIKGEKKEQDELSSGLIDKQVKNAGNLKLVEKMISECERLGEDENLFLCRQKFSLNEFKKHKENIEREFFNLEKDLEGIKEYTQDGLEASVIRIQKDLDDRSRLLDDDRLLKWLQKEGMKNDDIHKLASLFSTELVNTPMEKVEVKNKKLLMQNIISITDKVSNNFYEDSAVKIEIEQKQFQKLMDREEINKQIVGLQVELRKAKERLSFFLEQAGKISDLNKLNSQRNANTELLKSYERFAELSSKLPELKSKASELKNTQSELSGKIKLHKNNMAGLDEEFQELNESLVEKKTSLGTLNGDYSSLEATVRQHFPDVINDEVEFKKEELELDFLLSELPVFKNQIEEGGLISGSSGVASIEMNTLWMAGTATSHGSLLLNGLKAFNPLSNTAAAIALLNGGENNSKIMFTFSGGKAEKESLVSFILQTLQKKLLHSEAAPLLMAAPEFQNIATQPPIIFAPGKSEIDARDAPLLASYARLLKTYPNLVLVLTASAN
ncbi:MAG: hypothetical protein WCS27_10220, partial [Victivallaceae bacterium]